jgi:hypothetical protein
MTEEFDKETKQYLAEILVRENTTSDELIKTLIRDRWLSLQNQTSSETVSSHSEPSRQGAALSSSKQKSSKQTIAAFVRKKHCR